jgi:hypothetical protein
MKSILLAVPFLFLAANVQASDAAVAPATQTPANLTIDAPIETLLADERAKAVVDAHLPGIASHPAYGQFKAMSLRAVQPFSQGMITDEVLAKIEADLAAIK